jgi:CspA family cold shock protein
MSTFYRLILSAVIAAAAIASLQLFNNTPGAEFSFNPAEFLIIFIACVIVALISPAIKATASLPIKLSGGGNREQGQVKWFNVSKGYGFVTRSSGEDIFVHFRSIRGEGRKVLREGQKVEFCVTDGDKGPQADDVELLD